MNFSNFTFFNGFNPAIVVLLAIWELVWKGLGMWTAAKNNQRNWFIAILVINSVGILPILYLYVFDKNKKKKK